MEGSYCKEPGRYGTSSPGPATLIPPATGTSLAVQLFDGDGQSAVAGAGRGKHVSCGWESGTDG